MKIRIEDDFDLDKIAYSGQCFRFHKCEDGGYRMISGDKMTHIRNIGDKRYEIDCSQNEYETYWKNYLDLDENYAKIRGLVPEKDKFLSGAASIGTGIRILNQEPYEMLISYLISQRRSIPSIQTCIEKLCSIAGEEMVDTVLVRKPDGTMVEEEQICYAFPTAKAMYEMSDEEYSSCGFGYREKYIRTAARLVAFGELDLEAMRKLSDEELYDSLISLYGVGPKVANCIMLFAYHRLDIFPRDVWINRVVDTYYGGDYDLTCYAPYNGVMQQYMFYAARNQL